jgi:tetratricopeptide (TPR) repeat protein
LASWKGYAATSILSAAIGSVVTLLAYRYYATPTMGLDDVQKMVGRGDFDSAIPELKRHLRRDRANSRAHLILAGALTGTNDHAAALEHLQVIPDRSIWAVEARFREGLLQLRPFGRAGMAESLWKKALEIDEAADPTSISPMGRAATVELLTLYIHQHRQREAADLVWRWHGRATAENRGRAAIALLALEFGPGPLPADRIADLENWIAADPSDVKSRRALGRAYVEMGNKAESGLAILKELVDSEPNDLDHWATYLSALAEHGDVDTMREAVKNLPPAADNDVDCWRLRGMMHEMSQQWHEATECFLKALEFDASRREVYAHISYVLRRAGDLERAMKFEQSGSDLNAAEDQLHIAYEQLTASQSRPVAESAYQLGELYEKRGRLREARVWYEDAVRLKPDYQQAGEAFDRVRKLLSSR